MSKIRCVALLVLGSVSICHGQSDPSGKDWLMHGRTYDDHRFSQLREINEQNVATLGLAWSHELDTTRGLEATPLVKNGILYFTGAWSVVYAYDAKSGRLRWKFDPKVSRENAYFYCCDVVNRGVALYAGKVFVGTLDGRLVALNERTGFPEWTVNTVENNNRAYSITAAPRIARGKVVIGNAGSEYGVRGYVSAYDAETGKLSWRFYAVPGNPANGFESKAMEEAAKTWHGDWWTFGGGGTPWEGMAYDPELDLLYFGTGNPTAWYRELRGGGTSLYTACILAVHGNNGELAWYFQTTPGDNWDYDATQPFVQADLKINGQLRKTIMQANKNGFFYVLDRQTGEFITGSACVDGINWAKGLDNKGRPIENPGVTELKARLISPGPFGGHNWTPMAYDDSTGLVYLSAKSGTFFLHSPGTEVRYDPDRWNHGLTDYDGPLSAEWGAAPPVRGELLAWDPVANKAAWHAPSPVAETGGVLATAGNLVFQGRGDGVFAAYRATDGKQLWSFDAGTGIIAAPVTYSVDGEQYVTILAGWGGASGLISFPGYGPVRPGYGRILTFKLNSHTIFSPPVYKHENPPVNLTTDASPELIKKGGVIYGDNCSVCHGIGAIAGPVPDLRYLSKAKLDRLEDIVLHGALSKAGMPSFSKILKAEEVDAIRAYLISRSRDLAAQK
jgi:PQQ-dependent dehydrogenase (methanol/ethanol family)